MWRSSVDREEREDLEWLVGFSEAATIGAARKVTCERKVSPVVQGSQRRRWEVAEGKVRERKKGSSEENKEREERKEKDERGREGRK